MTWNDNLRRVSLTVNGKKRNLIGGSFRGVAFFVDVSELESGRRVVTHQFPFRKNPFREDLGQAARSFHIDGYVIGDDYLAQKNALLTALDDTDGPGQLVHPYWGVLSAIAEKVGVRETRTEGRYAAFAIEFAETPAQTPVPVTSADATGAVSDSADAAATASDAEFAQKYNPNNLPSYALASASTALSSEATAMKNDLGPVIADTQELAALNAQATLIVAQASSLVSEPSLIMGQVRDAITALANTVLGAPDKLMAALTAVYSFDPGQPVIATTATRVQELANQTALSSALRRVFAVEAARLAPTVVYATIEDALAARDGVSSMLDAEAQVADDTAYGALVDLRSQVQQAVPGTAAFASVVTVTRRVSIPSLLLAYQLYGSVDLEPDILARNDVMHPGFVLGDLKVLSNAG